MFVFDHIPWVCDSLRDDIDIDKTGQNKHAGAARAGAESASSAVVACMSRQPRP